MSEIDDIRGSNVEEVDDAASDRDDVGGVHASDSGVDWSVSGMLDDSACVGIVGSTVEGTLNTCVAGSADVE